MARRKKEPILSTPSGLSNSGITDFRNQDYVNLKLSKDFADDVLRTFGFEVNEDGYVLDMEDEDDIKHVYVKGKYLKMATGIFHDEDMVFDPYNNSIIMPELFRQYVEENHQNISTYPLFSTEKRKIKQRYDIKGFIKILYGNGATIMTDEHIKDATKYLDALMRLQSMTDPFIRPILQQYDKYELEVYEKIIKEGM